MSAMAAAMHAAHPWAAFRMRWLGVTLTNVSRGCGNCSRQQSHAYASTSGQSHDTINGASHKTSGDKGPTEQGTVEDKMENARRWRIVVRALGLHGVATHRFAVHQTYLHDALAELYTMVMDAEDSNMFANRHQ